jgi:hypothetical protein
MRLRASPTRREYKEKVRAKKNEIMENVFIRKWQQATTLYVSTFWKIHINRNYFSALPYTG